MAQSLHLHSSTVNGCYEHYYIVGSAISLHQASYLNRHLLSVKKMVVKKLTQVNQLCDLASFIAIQVMHSHYAMFVNLLSFTHATTDDDGMQIEKEGCVDL